MQRLYSYLSLANTSKKEEEQHSDSYFTLIEVLLIKLLVPCIIILYIKNLVNNLNN